MPFGWLAWPSPPGPLGRQTSPESTAHSDYQLGNWLVMPGRPPYLQVKGYLRCPWMTAADRLRPWRRARNGHAARLRPSGCKLLARPWSPSNCAAYRVPMSAQDSCSAHGLLYPVLYRTTGASIKSLGSLLLSFSHDFACDSQKICDTSPGV